MKYDKRQLLKDAFDCKETFKVPVGFWHHFVLGKDQFMGDMEESFHHKFASKPQVVAGNMAALAMAWEEVQAG